MSRNSYQIELFHPSVWILFPCSDVDNPLAFTYVIKHKHTNTHKHTHSGTHSAQCILPCLQEEWLDFSFLLTPASWFAGRVVWCRSKVTGQDVAVTPFPLLMCSSVTLATALREVVLLRNGEMQGVTDKKRLVSQQQWREVSRGKKWQWCFFSTKLKKQQNKTKTKKHKKGRNVQ